MDGFAVEQLDLQPFDRVLEVGIGDGISLLTLMPAPPLLPASINRTTW